MYDPSDPLDWLIARMREAREVIPNATLADEFEYAMIAAEHQGESWDTQMSDSNLLSKTYAYKVRTPDECFWRFQWGDFVDYTGHHWGWQAYHFNVGEGQTRVGIWKEQDVIQQLGLYGHKLDEVDWDDLRFWVNLQWESDIANTRLSDTLVT